MSHSFHDPFIQGQPSLYQAFAVAGRTSPPDSGACRKLLANPADNVDGCPERIAFIRGVMRKNNAVRLIDDHRFNGGRAGVNPQPTASFRFLRVQRLDTIALVTLTELRQFRVVVKQRAHPGGLVDDFGLFQAFNQDFQALRGGSLATRTPSVGQQGAAQGHKELRVGGCVKVFHFGKQFFISLAQFRQEVQRATQEHDVAAERAAVGEARNCLRSYCHKYRGGNVRVSGALVQQRLNVGFGKNAAT